MRSRHHAGWLTIPLRRHSAPVPTALFLSHNESLAPPYRVLVDTNFINLSLENRLEMVSGMMDSLYAKCAFPTHLSSL